MQVPQAPHLILLVQCVQERQYNKLNQLILAPHIREMKGQTDSNSQG